MAVEWAVAGWAESEMSVGRIRRALRGRLLTESFFEEVEEPIVTNSLFNDSANNNSVKIVSLAVHTCIILEKFWEHEGRLLTESFFEEWWGMILLFGMG